MTVQTTIRTMEKSDLAEVGQLAGTLVRLHHGWDEQRFMLVAGVEDGYRRYFESQLGVENVLLLVATRGERVVGYLYGALEGRDWNLLLERHGAIHDVCVTPGERHGGIGTALMEEACARLKAQGAQRVVLMSAQSNVEGQKLFEKLGFRRTMVEMTREL